jgi:hypothetical protein
MKPSASKHLQILSKVIKRVWAIYKSSEYCFDCVQIALNIIKSEFYQFDQFEKFCRNEVKFGPFENFEMIAA